MTFKSPELNEFFGLSEYKNFVEEGSQMSIRAGIINQDLVNGIGCEKPKMEVDLPHGIGTLTIRWSNSASREQVESYAKSIVDAITENTE